MWTTAIMVAAVVCTHDRRTHLLECSRCKPRRCRLSIFCYVSSIVDEFTQAVPLTLSSSCPTLSDPVPDDIWLLQKRNQVTISSSQTQASPCHQLPHTRKGCSLAHDRISDQPSPIPTMDSPMHDSFNLSASLHDQPRAFMADSSPLPTSLDSGDHIPASMDDAHPSAGPSQPAVRGSSHTPQEDSPVQDAVLTGAPSQQASDPGPQEGSACHGIFDGAGSESHPSGKHAGVHAQQSSLSSLQLLMQHKPADNLHQQEQASEGTPSSKDNSTQIADKQIAAQQPHRSSGPCRAWQALKPSTSHHSSNLAFFIS